VRRRRTGGSPVTRVVVVGNGMVGSRFVEELVRRDDSVQVTVLGAEEYEPYNRVLLSEVVAGRVDVASLALPRVAFDGVTVACGVEVTAVDRPGRVVTGADGRRFGYDVLVLATGARARVPEIPGLTTDHLPAGVHPLRTLDDAREITAATVNARRAVVLGAGVLGLEAACGLAQRGLHVTVVHRGSHLMDRQLDAEAAAAVGHGLARLGIGHRVGARTTAILVADGHLRGVLLGDGERLDADLLVLAAGTVPESGIAARAGLDVRRGIVVDADCATSDPAIFAIGDCAEPPGGASGLIAQGWDQARRLATLLAGRAAAAVEPGSVSAAARRDTRGTDVVRLKAHGLDVVTMGVPPGTDPARRSVRLSDPAAGRLIEVVVEGGVVVGATCVGAGAVAADILTAYTRGTPTPVDPAHLLLRTVGGAPRGVEASPTLMPHRTTVCRCNGVTKGDLVASWRDGARTQADVARVTRATTGCGGCTDMVCGLLEWLGRSEAGPAGPAAEGSADPMPSPASDVLVG
jgi:assimilatory nitrate reductase electron transfer subunit